MQANLIDRTIAVGERSGKAKALKMVTHLLPILAHLEPKYQLVTLLDWLECQAKAMAREAAAEIAP